MADLSNNFETETTANHAPHLPMMQLEITPDQIEQLRQNINARIDAANLTPARREELKADVNSMLAGTPLNLAPLNNLISALPITTDAQQDLEQQNQFVTQELMAAAADAHFEAEYGLLSTHGRHRVDEVFNLLHKQNWTEQDKLAVLRDTVIPDDLANTALGAEAAKKLLHMKGTEQELATLKEHPDGARKTQIENQLAEEHVQQKIAHLSQPAKADAQMIARVSSPQDAEKELNAHANDPQKLAEIAKTKMADFVRKGSQYTNEIVGMMSDEERKHLPKNGLQGSVDAVRDMYKNGGKETPETHAALDLVTTTGSKLLLKEFVAAAIEHDKVKGTSKEATNEFAILFDKHATEKQREEAVAASVEKRLGNVPESKRAEMAHQIAQNVLTQVNKEYGSGHIDKIATASNDTLNKMSHNAALDTASDITTNFFTFDDKQTDKVSLAAGRGTRRTLERWGMSEEHAQTLGHGVTWALEKGAEIKKAALHDAPQMLLNAITGGDEPAHAKAPVKNLDYAVEVFEKLKLSKDVTTDKNSHKHSTFDFEKVDAKHSKAEVEKHNQAELDKKLHEIGKSLKDIENKDGTIDIAKFGAAMRDVEKFENASPGDLLTPPATPASAKPKTAAQHGH